MRMKQLATLVLSIFVLGSLGYLVVSEIRGGSGAAPDGAGPATTEAEEAPPPFQVVAYYFHGTQRCTTCRTIEAYTVEALEAGFREELADGKLVLRIVNIEEPGNEHFVEDFELSTRTVVLAAVVEGEQVEWASLPRVWELVGDREAFLAYIQSEAERFLERTHG